MENFTPAAPISLAPLIFMVAAIGSGIAAMTGRRLLAIALGLVAVAALGGVALWTVMP